jgi:hypothetical protein
VLVRLLMVGGESREVARQVVFAILLAELLAGAGGRGRAERGAFPARRPARSPGPRRSHVGARSSLAGRRPRG